MSQHGGFYSLNGRRMESANEVVTLSSMCLLHSYCLLLSFVLYLFHVQCFPRLASHLFEALTLAELTGSCSSAATGM
jgi:hypothetical protein